MPSSSSDPLSSSEKEFGSLVESREKSSIEAGSEGDVMMSGDDCSGCSVAGVMLAVAELVLLSLDASMDRKVGRLGVDLDWKPCGIGGGFVPLL